MEEIGIRGVEANSTELFIFCSYLRKVSSPQPAV